MSGTAVIRNISANRDTAPLELGSWRGDRHTQVPTGGHLGMPGRPVTPKDIGSLFQYLDQVKVDADADADGPRSQSGSELLRGRAKLMMEKGDEPILGLVVRKEFGNVLADIGINFSKEAKQATGLKDVNARARFRDWDTVQPKSFYGRALLEPSNFGGLRVIRLRETRQAEGKQQPGENRIYVTPEVEAILKRRFVDVAVHQERVAGPVQLLPPQTAPSSPLGNQMQELVKTIVPAINAKRKEKADAKNQAAQAQRQAQRKMDESQRNTSDGPFTPLIEMWRQLASGRPSP